MTALAAILFLFGLAIGSFLNVVIHRVPRKESVVWPASRCPECGARIRVEDNIPLLSYLLLRGACRQCRAGIPVRYPAVELLTGLLFAAAAYRFGASLELAHALALVCALVALAGTDLEHRILPNALIAPALTAGLALSISSNPDGWWIYPVSALAVGGFLLALALFYPGGMGMGDVKMGAMLGAFLGGYAALAVFFGAVVGALAGGVLMWAGLAGRRTALPFGVFMALGGLAALFWGESVWSGYLRILGGG